MYLEKVVGAWVHWTLELDAREQIKTKKWQRGVWERAWHLSQTDQSSSPGSAASTVRLRSHSFLSCCIQPSIPPSTSFSLHWVPFVCTWLCTSPISNQQTSPSAFLTPFGFHPGVSSLCCRVSQRSRPHAPSPRLQSLPSSRPWMI